MSQTVEQFEANYSHGGVDEFQYRPMPVLAPVSVVIGICSIMALASMIGIGIALVGVVLGAIGVWQIRRAAGELGGKAIATAGLCLSALFLVSGSTLHAYNFATEVPEGHIRVNFPDDISKKEFVVADGKRQIHPDVSPFVDQDIYIKGYMWNNRMESGLTSFVMLKDNGKCCFGGDPAPFDMMVVRMQNDQTADYMSGLIAVAGQLRANPDAAPDEPVYVLEATMVERAKTAF